MSPFDRTSRSTNSNHKPLSKRLRRRKASAKARANLLHERLEGRAMMAIYTAGGGPLSNFAVIASDNASDVYVQQRAGLATHSGETLLIADNSSFLANDNFHEIAVPDILYVTNGTEGRGPGEMEAGNHASGALGDGYRNDARLESTTYFSLSNGNIRLPVYALGFNTGIRIPVLSPPDNPVEFWSENYQIDNSSNPFVGTSEFRGEVSFGGDRWQFEVVPDSGEMRFRPADYIARLSTTTAVNSRTITLANTDGLSVGMRVFGFRIEPNASTQEIGAGTTIVSINPSTNTVELSRPQNWAAGGLLGFATLNASAQPIRGGVATGAIAFSNGDGNGQRGWVSIDWGRYDPAGNLTSVDVPTVTFSSGGPPMIASVSYGYRGRQGDGWVLKRSNETTISASAVNLDSQLNAGSSSTSFEFDIPDGPFLPGVIPGTLRGNLLINGSPLRFQTDFVGGSTLYFNLTDGDSGNALPFGEVNWVRVAGSFVQTLALATGDRSVTMNFSFTNAFPTDSGDELPEDGTNQGDEGRLAVVPRSVVLKSVEFIAYVQDPSPNSFIVSAGHDLTSQLEVELLTPASTIDINSRVAVTTKLNDDDSNREDVILRATTITIDSEVASRDYFRVGPASAITGLGVATAVAETLRVNAPVAAPIEFIIDVADDPGTSPNPGSVFDGPLKGLISLSASGSFSGALAPTTSAISAPSELITIRGKQTDIYVAGQIYGTKQTYLLNSDAAAQGLAPYVFATSAENTGVNGGLIRGDNVAITLGNDAPTPLDQSIAFNTLDLNTKIASLRIKAATQQQTVPLPTPSASGPFPYNLTIREEDDISIDAVAASGLPLSIESGGNMRFTSALSTAGDVSLRALSGTTTPSRLTVSSPLATTKGRIRLVGDGVALNNSVLVTGADDDEFRDDIWITANAGDVALNGLVSAVNRIKIEQFNPLGPTDSPYSKRDVLLLPDLSTVTQTLRVDDDFTFDNLDVELDITHTFVGDLTITLIAPDQRRFRLFDRQGGSGDNLTGTIFDSEATNPISAGVAPFTGRFRPVDSLSQLYGGSSLGTWRLEVRDNAGGDSGSLTNFTLRFQTLEPQAAKVFGPARVVADTLQLDVQGEVGNSKLLPVDVNFFLRTDVDTLTGTVGKGASFDELNDIHIPSLRAGGAVSLRANGVDPSSGANAGRPALLASLIDITGLDVAAPNGSIDVLFDTSRKIELGNGKALSSGRSLNSVAAGDVKIRSTAGSIVALDAPVAGGNARIVRVATTEPLATAVNGQSLSLLTYSPGNPGVTPSTLRGRGNLNDWFGVQVQPLRVGDRVLVKNQGNASQNGVYSVTFMSTPTWTSTTTWTLTRALDSDTAAELPANTFVSVGERQAGNVNQVGTWQITANYIPLNGATAVVDGAVTAGSTAVTVTADTAANIQPGMVVFGENIAANTTVEPFSGGNIIPLSLPTGAIADKVVLKFVAPAITRQGATNAGLDDILITGLSTTSDLEAGMLVVGAGIPDDTVITRILNGSTVVISRSAISTTGSIWTNSSTTVTVESTVGLQEGMTVVGPGIPTGTTVDSIDSSTTFTLSQLPTVDSGPDGETLAFTFVGDVKFIRPFATRTGTTTTSVGTTAVSGLSATRDLSEGMVVIGPGIPADTTIASIVNGTTITLSRPATFDQSGVSLKFLAAAPTNFGRAPISVAKKDVTTNIGSNNPNTTVTFVVSTNAGTNSAAGSLGKMITLRQQNIATLGNDDAEEPGSQPMGFQFSASVATDITPIRLTQELPEITKAFTISGAQTYPGVAPAGSKAAPPLIDGSRITHTRTGRNVVAGDLVNGLVVSGSDASGTIIRNVNIGGFSRVVGGSQSAAILVHDAEGVLVRNVTLGASELGPGVRLSNGHGVRFTGPGTTSGTLLNSNVFGSNGSGLVVNGGASGVSVVGSTFGRADNFNVNGATLGSGVNQFGVDPSTPVRPIPQVQATRVAANGLQFTLPSDWSPWRLVPGLQILSPGVMPTSGNARATISAVAITATTVTVTVTGGTVVGVPGNSTSPFGVTFIAADPAAIPDSLATRVENRFTLPTSQATGITTGMQVSGPNIRLAAGSRAATVRQVGPSNGVTTFEITGGTIVGNGPVTFGSTPAARFDRQAVKVVNAFTLSAAARSVSALLYSGLALTGPTIQVDAAGNPDVPNRTPASISAIERNLTTGVTTVTIAGGTLTGNGSVSFGHVVYTELNGRTITLPNSTVLDNLYLGQTVSGTGIAGGAVITAIDRANRTVTFAEDRKMTRTGFSVISFGIGGRNTVTQNRTGLILAGGATTVTNTTISANTFNGIEIRGSGYPEGTPMRHHRIGTTTGPVAGSNQIHSNGGWGIYFTPAVNGAKNSVTIEGNFLGTTSSAVVPSTLANRKGNIGHFTTREEVFARISSAMPQGELVPRGIDGVDFVNNQHGRYQSSGGSGSGGGGVR